jgi:hypothetical protein
MSDVPAFCDSCGAIFLAGENSENSSSQDNPVGPCPKCGGMGHFPDGDSNNAGEEAEIPTSTPRAAGGSGDDTSPEPHGFVGSFRRCQSCGRLEKDAVHVNRP